MDLDPPKWRSLQGRRQRQLKSWLPGEADCTGWIRIPELLHPQSAVPAAHAISPRRPGR
jgi:hypothetical protein